MVAVTGGDGGGGVEGGACALAVETKMATRALLSLLPRLNGICSQSHRHHHGCTGLGTEAAKKLRRGTETRQSANVTHNPFPIGPSTSITAARARWWARSGGNNLPCPARGSKCAELAGFAVEFLANLFNVCQVL